jgi:predicted aminopeptidase
MRMPNITPRRLFVAALLALLLVQTGGCYYMQAIRGHTDLMNRRRPVAEVMADQSSPEELKSKLELVSAARDFAVAELLLPENDSYRTYADLERDFVVWNVFAAPEFSLEPRTWCYPVAGCVAYRGYFSEAAARKLGAKLGEQEFDVAVGGVSAYSTLGRFSDPLLNTMMRWSDVDLVSTMFHELAHQKLYIKGDSAFNESFATAVADVGIERWLGKTGELDKLNAYHDRKKLRRSLVVLVAAARDELSSLYASEVAADAMRQDKKRILDTLSADAEMLIAADGAEVRNWLAAPLNNARLVSTNLYEGRVAMFKLILDECQHELACFYARTAELADLSTKDRNQRMDALSD